jgi:phosphoribosylformylglycinamidine synthase
MELQKLVFHPILTAETHNFPSGVAPFPGAETGTGGRLRDVQATGRGAHTVAGVSSYCVGNLHIPGHDLPWENSSSNPSNHQEKERYPPNLASPLDIIVEASNGASDYGNKYGEPVVAGFVRSFGLRLPGGAGNSKNNTTNTGERYEWLKPIMFTAGVGSMDSRHSVKGAPEVGMIVCKIGGPAYRIGMGGGAASSRVGGTGADSKEVDLDFNAVQRGDAEMENRMNRVIRACVEMGEKNPIVSIHDQGAGGNGNVLKEIVDPLGARFELRKIPVGDPTLSVREIWGAEYQENNAFLVRAGAALDTVLALGKRENCPVSAVGVVTGDGVVVVEDEHHRGGAEQQFTPFALPLSLVLGKMPQKSFSFVTPAKTHLRPLSLPADLTVNEVVERVLRLLSVGSKRFLTNKVDRSVTGLVAQQQCCGPLHTPLADVAVLAQTHFSLSGTAVAVGEQPIKGLVDNAAQARMTVAEALSNLVFARITSLSDVKASGNWMWAAKLPGEGAKMYECCSAMRDCLVALGPAIDGGKDSLSMAAKVINGNTPEEVETVKCPGEVTLTVYAGVPDITKTITPDFKRAGSKILFVDLSNGHFRLGGTALAQCFGQLGEDTADLNDTKQFKTCFEVIQSLLDEKGLLLAGHDKSDGGLLTTVLEMAFAGNMGFHLDFTQFPQFQSVASVPFFFNEELGFVFEVLSENCERVAHRFEKAGIPCLVIGETTVSKNIVIHYHHNQLEDQQIVENEMKETKESNKNRLSPVPMREEYVLHRSLMDLRDIWESTSFALEKLQCNVKCVQEEEKSLSRRATGPKYHLSFPAPQPILLNHLMNPLITTVTLKNKKPRVAVIRQEGSNGDREMLSAFFAAGFEVWDMNMNDLLSGRGTLDSLRGIVACGGFSYADVNDSAKGWAGVIQFNESLLKQFNHFIKERTDTFSLGVCNGCQLFALLGWVPFPDGRLPAEPGSRPTSTSAASGAIGPSESFPAHEQMRFIHNESGRFESRWSSLRVQKSPAILLKGMEGSVLGVHIAHGEGRAFFPNQKHLETIERMNLAPLRYVNDENEVTLEYPMNPNGSPNGIAAVCSADGRHFAMMPHPERCFLQWQLPYDPERYHQLNTSHYFKERDTTANNSNAELLVAPWMKLFQNAFEFCQSSK